MLVGYMRVSSENDRQNTDLQKDALLSSGVDERHLFEDRASGSKRERPGLKDALEFLRPGDTLVVWKLDRLGRSLSHLIGLINMLKEKEIGFRSLTEGIDTSTPSGKLLFHIFGSLAEYERSLIRERVNAGLQAARRRGKIGGRPRAISKEKLEVIVEALNNGMSKNLFKIFLRLKQRKQELPCAGWNSIFFRSFSIIFDISPAMQRIFLQPTS